MSDDEMCRCCQRRRQAPVCDRCRDRMLGQLAELPDLLERLPLAMVPGPGGGERVAATRTPPLPVRLDALTLTAGGGDARATFVPKVEVRSQTVIVDGVERVVWAREQVVDEHGRPVNALTDDQTGTMPVRVWLLEWEADWRRQFGHSDGLRRPVMAQKPPPVDQPTPEDAARVLLGLGPSLAPARRPADPVADEWRLRWRSPADLVTDRAHRYLTTWLEHACAHHPRIGDFAAGLRCLTGEVRAALGDTSDLEYLGRCPEEITDRVTDERVICGAAIWHDAYVDVIVCPRCRTETGQDRRIWLARRILDTWPVDPRRRYPFGLIAILRLPTCGACGQAVYVEWVDATERRDSERFWRPGRVSCRNGCDRREGWAYA